MPYRKFNQVSLLPRNHATGSVGAKHEAPPATQAMLAM